MTLQKETNFKTYDLLHVILSEAFYFKRKKRFRYSPKYGKNVRTHLSWVFEIERFSSRKSDDHCKKIRKIKSVRIWPLFLASEQTVKLFSVNSMGNGPFANSCIDFIAEKCTRS